MELEETEERAGVVMPAPFRGDAAAAAPSGTLGPVSGGAADGARPEEAWGEGFRAWGVVAVILRLEVC